MRRFNKEENHYPENWEHFNPESFQQISDKGLESLSKDDSIVENVVDPIEIELRNEMEKKRFVIAYLYKAPQITIELLKAIRDREGDNLSDDEINELIPLHGKKIMFSHGDTIFGGGLPYVNEGKIIEKYIWRDREILHIKSSGQIAPDIERVDIPYKQP